MACCINPPTAVLPPWQAVLRQTEDWIYSLAVDLNQPNDILAAGHASGPFLSESYGGAGEWQRISDNPGAITGDFYWKGRAVAYDPRAWTGLAHFAIWRGQSYRSTDRGETWTLIDNGLGDFYIDPNGLPIVQSHPDTIYMAAHSSNVAGVVRSNDAGLQLARSRVVWGDRLHRRGGRPEPGPAGRYVPGRPVPQHEPGRQLGAQHVWDLEFAGHGHGVSRREHCVSQHAERRPALKFYWRDNLDGGQQRPGRSRC